MSLYIFGYNLTIMRITQRSATDISKVLKKIENGTFLQDDIRLLFTQLRPHSKDYDLVWEMACFMAHPEERDRGVFQRALDSKYARIIYGKVFGTPNSKKISPYLMNSNLFDCLLVEGIKDTDSAELLNEIGMNQEQAIAKLNRAYIKQGKTRYLRANESLSGLNPIFKSVLYQMRFFAAIDNERLFDQLKVLIDEVCKHLGLSTDVYKLLELHRNDILVCIICLLHSHEFLLFDGEICRCTISISDSFGKSKIDLFAEVKLEGPLVCWPLISLDTDCSGYLPDEWSSETPPFNTIRTDDGQLVLEEY